jgi:hypothetical protein
MPQASLGTGVCADSPQIRSENSTLAKNMLGNQKNAALGYFEYLLENNRDFQFIRFSIFVYMLS